MPCIRLLAGAAGSRVRRIAVRPAGRTPIRATVGAAVLAGLVARTRTAGLPVLGTTILKVAVLGGLVRGVPVLRPPAGGAAVGTGAGVRTIGSRVVLVGALLAVGTVLSRACIGPAGARVVLIGPLRTAGAIRALGAGPCVGTIGGRVVLVGTLLAVGAVGTVRALLTVGTIRAIRPVGTRRAIRLLPLGGGLLARCLTLFRLRPGATGLRRLPGLGALAGRGGLTVGPLPLRGRGRTLGAWLGPLAHAGSGAAPLGPAAAPLGATATALHAGATGAARPAAPRSTARTVLSHLSEVDHVRPRPDGVREDQAGQDRAGQEKEAVTLHRQLARFGPSRTSQVPNGSRPGCVRST